MYRLFPIHRFGFVSLRWLIVFGVALSLAIGRSRPVAAQAAACPEPALSRVIRHRVAPGETVASIAQQYNLIPATLMGFNPALRSGTATVGSEVLIPPYNGIRVEVPAGRSWREVAKTYNVRADALYEINGCQNAPRAVFVPGVNWSPTAAVSPTPHTVSSNPLSQYPLPAIAPILTTYGWQLDANSGRMVFQSGVNLGTAAGTPVLAAGAGTVAFAGEQQGYGKLIVINHAQGMQTRYSQLASVFVHTGQQVQPGTRIGTVTGTETPPYLHFEVRSNSNLGWVAQDPSTYFPGLRTADQRRNRGLGGREVEQ